ncbi:MAG: hypothetical protein E6K81_00130 [Candidatus Eisenbacteria bacterium]|uniref:Uncharacterized protein n=1 Tax=Eiseniibacteriota bacterium TaxID=2212470 RepID=A0A538UEI2_UNCEI|nr:MAG: hypothetical protein E6K81_00130 [Candidatus Eisenbacteria bacterium]
MKKLVLLALIAFAAWYGWKHYKSLLLERRPMHEAVVENQTGVGLTRVRLTVDGQTFVREELPDKGRASFPFRVGRDAAFRLVWQWSDRTTENTWNGGMVAVGPMVQRHVMVIGSDAGVLYRAEPK